MPPNVPGSRDYQTATELLSALRAKQISALELADMTIARIEAVDSGINAVVDRDFDGARAAAKAADQVLSQGITLPLLGLPMTVKEQFNVAGLSTTWGNPAFKGWKPDADALAVSRLKAAGAIIVGKTNVPFMMGDCQSYNEIYGTTNNPWNKALTPGGSSGGSAASLAAGYVSLELGSDLAGSLRIPAGFCGVYSHKPSINLIPLRGALLPRMPAWPYRGNLTTGDWAVAGPMARSAADLSIGFDVLAGPDELSDGIGYSLALPKSRHDSLNGFRILLLDTHPLCPIATTVRSAIEALASRLQHSGCQLIRASEALPDLAITGHVFTQLLQSNLTADLPEAVLEKVRNAVAALDPDDKSLEALAMRAMLLDYREWRRISKAGAELVHKWRQIFTTIDVIICPITATPAFPHNHEPLQSKRSVDVDNKRIPMRDSCIWASIASLAGLPATAVPIGLSDMGLPIGIQIIGPYLEDRTTIRFAELMEREYGGFVPPAQSS